MMHCNNIIVAMHKCQAFFMKNIFITGVNRGIGFFLTKELLKRGHSVIGTYRKASDNNNLQKLKSAFPKTLNLTCLDVKVLEQDELTRYLNSFRAVDILINNAGILDCGNVSFEKLQIDDLLRSIQVNTLGPMKITQLLLPKLTESASPRVFHMTSQMGSIADNQSGGYYFYRISKASLNMFNKSFSQDYPSIPSIVIHPGWVRTDMGGNHAPISPEDAAISVSDLLLTAKNLSSGNFYNYKGEILPW